MLVATCDSLLFRSTRSVWLVGLCDRLHVPLFSGTKALVSSPQTDSRWEWTWNKIDGKIAFSCSAFQTALRIAFGNKFKQFRNEHTKALRSRWLRLVKGSSSISGWMPSFVIELRWKPNSACFTYRNFPCLPKSFKQSARWTRNNWNARSTEN